MSADDIFGASLERALEVDADERRQRARVAAEAEAHALVPHRLAEMISAVHRALIASGKPLVPVYEPELGTELSVTEVVRKGTWYRSADTREVPTSIQVPAPTRSAWTYADARPWSSGRGLKFINLMMMSDGILAEWGPTYETRHQSNPNRKPWWPTQLFMSWEGLHPGTTGVCLLAQNLAVPRVGLGETLGLLHDEIVLNRSGYADGWNSTAYGLGRVLALWYTNLTQHS